MINILVTGAGGGVGQGIIKSLKMIDDLKINIVAADMSALATGLYAGNISYLVPECISDNYLTSLIEIFLTEKIHYYFPGTDIELEFCARNKELIKNRYNVEVVISDIETILISNDKYKTYKFLVQNNYYYPKTYLPSKIDSNKLEYPVIVKPAIGCNSIGVGIINDKNELDERLSQETGLIIQELVGTNETEYTCTIIIVNGQISDVLILRRILRAGDTYRAEPIKSNIIADYVRDVAIALNIKGSCNFQLRTDADGIPKIFEINCRFSGTTPFCSQLGLNPVEFYLKNSLSEDYNYKIDYKSVVMRYWSEVLVDRKTIEELKKSQANKPIYNKKISLFKKVN